MSSALKNIIISILMIIICIILYTIYNKTAIFGAMLVALSIHIKSIVDYYRHRKVYKFFLNKEVG